MTMRIDPDELDNLRDITRAVVDIVGPALMKCIAAAQPGVTIVGELLTSEPARNYRKEVWIAGFAFQQSWHDHDKYADIALEAFDKRFPK